MLEKTFNNQFDKHCKEMHGYRYGRCPKLGCFIGWRFERRLNKGRTIGGMLLLGIDEILPEDEPENVILQALAKQKQHVYRARFQKQQKTGFVLMTISEEIYADAGSPKFEELMIHAAADNIEEFITKDFIKQAEEQRIKSNGSAGNE
jgi:hypothetical protein